MADDKDFAGKNLTEKAMFGGLAFLINGHMAVARAGGGLMLRMDPAQTEIPNMHGL